MNESTSQFGRHVKQWRRQRGLSQLQLATQAELSQRYLSFIETGRSRPGEEVVLRVAAALDLPIRERNALLVAAGLPAKFPELTLSHADLAPFRSAIERMLQNHDPYPAYVVNRWWDVVDANATGKFLFPENSEESVNTIDVFLAPGPVRNMIENFPEVSWQFLYRLRKEVANSSPDSRMRALLERAEEYLSDVPPPDDLMDSSSDLVICPQLRVGEQSIKTFSMVARFGHSREVNLDELRVELLYPADEIADACFREMHRLAQN